MLDHRIRPLIDPPLDALGRRLAAAGITADGLTVGGFFVGLGAVVAIALHCWWTALALICVNRIVDGLDGAVARATRRTDRGAFLDIALDFVFYAAVPAAFAVADPARNALPAALLLASFLANGAAFLAFAALAGRRGLETRAQGAKSLYYVAGLAEGTETVVVFIAMCLWPAAFVWLACAFAVLCLASAAARIVLGARTFGDDGA